VGCFVERDQLYIKKELNGCISQYTNGKFASINMICIRLDKQIEANSLLSKIESLASEHLYLYIDIKNISYTSDELILKLEHKLDN
jgi:hypothetical protein